MSIGAVQGDVAFIPRGIVESLAESDPLRQLITRHRDGAVMQPGSVERQFFEVTQRANPELPPQALSQLAWAVLSCEEKIAHLASRQEQMQAFFAAWNESIEENNRQEKAAAKKRALTTAEEKRLLNAALHKAVGLGYVEAAFADRLLRRVAAGNEEAPPVKSGATASRVELAIQAPVAGVGVRAGKPWLT